MIYQRANGKIITTAAGKLYTGACPPPPNCCRGWDGEPPWGPGGPTPWFDPSAPDEPEYRQGCPQPPAHPGGTTLEEITRCADVGNILTTCVFCCCPTSCKMIDDPNPIDPNAPPGTYLIPTTECQWNGFTSRLRWTYLSREVRPTGTTEYEEIFESNVTWSQRPNATAGDCCEWAGSATFTRRIKTPLGETTTVNPMTPSAFNCFASNPYIGSGGLFRCFGHQPPPPDPLSCNGLCDVDVMRAFFDCRRSTFRRYQRLAFVDGGFSDVEWKGFMQFSAPASGDPRNTRAFLKDTPECRGIIGGGGNLP